MAEIWLNGDFVPAEGAIAASDRGLLLADGAFDTALVIGGRVFLREHHVARLAAAAETLEIPFDQGALEAAFDALAARQENGSLRITLTRGPASRGLAFPAQATPTLFGSTSPLVPSAMFAPVRLDVSSIRRNETSPSSRIKSLAYLDAVLANRAAHQAGAKEALFLNTRDRLACTASANIFLLVGDELLTPPLSDGAVDGTIRRWIVENAGRFGLQSRDRPLHLDEIASGTLFLTNSLRLLAAGWLTPVGEGRLDERLTDIMRALCEAVAEECGTDPRDLGANLPEF